MELRTTREMRRNEQLSKVMAKKAEGEVQAQAQPAVKQQKTPADKLTLSQQALAFVEEQQRNMWDAAQERGQSKDGRIGGMLDAMEAKKKELDSMNEKLNMLDKCQKIAAAIMRGDRVPPEDLKYLMEHDQEGFKMALALRKPKKDPEDVESVLDDEDRGGGSVEESGGGGEAPSVSAPEASSGGGEASASAE